MSKAPNSTSTEHDLITVATELPTRAQATLLSESVRPSGDVLIEELKHRSHTAPAVVTAQDKAFMQFTKDFLETIDRPPLKRRILIFLARIWDRLAAPYRRAQQRRFQREQAHRERVIAEALRAEEDSRAKQSATVTQREVEEATIKFNTPGFVSEVKPRPTEPLQDDQLIKAAVNKLKY
jgi:hypothetical protein